MTSFAAEARRTYNIDQWGSGYFDVGQDGLTLVRPHGEPGTPALPLISLIDKARAQGLRLPLLVRFADIVHRLVEQHRIGDAVAGEGVDDQALLVRQDRLDERHVQIEHALVEIDHVLDEGDLELQSRFLLCPLDLAELQHQHLHLQQMQQQKLNNPKLLKKHRKRMQ